MQTLAGLLPHIYDKCFKHKKPENYIDHGIGVLTIEEHDYLVQSKAINCDGNHDSIHADAYCVISESKGERFLIYEGTKFNCEQEVEAQRKQKPNVYFKVSQYPKTYLNFRALQAEQEQDNGMDDLVNTFGGVIVQ